MFSSISAGWGAVTIYFPPAGDCTLRQVFGLPAHGVLAGQSYVQHFAPLMGRLKSVLAPEVVDAMAKALTIMEDGTPCPAPHVAPGSWSVGALAVTAAVRVLAGLPVAAAPKMIMVDLFSACTLQTVDMI